MSIALGRFPTNKYMELPMDISIYPKNTGKIKIYEINTQSLYISCSIPYNFT